MGGLENFLRLNQGDWKTQGLEKRGYVYLDQLLSHFLSYDQFILSSYDQFFVSSYDHYFIQVGCA